MPIYEYACQKCGHVVEVFQKLNDKGPGKCPKCGGKLARVLSHTSFQLKGGGWYKDLYSSVKPGGDGDSEGPKPTEKSDAKSDGKAEAKPEAKSDANSDVKAKVEAKAEAKAAKPEAKSKPAAPKAKRKSSKG